MRLTDNHTFAYRYWSDDVASRRYGQGTYQLRSHKLHLQFEAALPVAATAVARPLATSPDSLVLEFLVLARPSSSVAEAEPLAYATIAATTELGKVVVIAMSDTAGRAVLRLPRNARWLNIQSLGFSPWRQECPPSSTAYRVELPINKGAPYAAGTSMIFNLVRLHPTNTLVMRQGAAQALFNLQLSAQ